MRLTGDRFHLSRDGPRSNPWRMLVYSVLIVSGIALTWMVKTNQVQRPFSPAYTPTRTALSYGEEGRTYFSAGDLTSAIQSYQRAVQHDPNDSRLWAELARVQTYSSALLTTTEERRARLSEARDSADRAVETNPDDSFAQAVRALVYDWSSSAEVDAGGAGRQQEYLNVAQTSSARALQLEPGSPLALAFYAEVLVDQQNFAQAIEIAGQAADLADPQDPFSMDIHRVYGTVLEYNAQYRLAIEEYLRAVDVAPNFTYLYLLIGANYRQLRDIDEALSYFERAVRINEQLEIEDPTPYLAIGKTYLQEGEFFVAAINIERALEIDSANSDIYGRLGIVFFKARNYEGAVVALQCAVDGCPTAVSRELLCEYVYDCDPQAEEAQQYGVDVVGLELTDGSLEYYYTYGSVLVYFRDTAEFPTACADAERVFEQLLARYGGDPIVAGIAAENRSLCLGLEPTPESGTAPIPESTATGGQ